jgi:hypothetical protein
LAEQEKRLAAEVFVLPAEKGEGPVLYLAVLL